MLRRCSCRGDNAGVEVGVIRASPTTARRRSGLLIDLPGPLRASRVLEIDEDQAPYSFCWRTSRTSTDAAGHLSSSNCRRGTWAYSTALIWSRARYPRTHGSTTGLAGTRPSFTQDSNESNVSGTSAARSAPTRATPARSHDRYQDSAAVARSGAVRRGALSVATDALSSRIVARKSVRYAPPGWSARNCRCRLGAGRPGLDGGRHSHSRVWNNATV